MHIRRKVIAVACASALALNACGEDSGSKSGEKGLGTTIPKTELTVTTTTTVATPGTWPAIEGNSERWWIEHGQEFSDTYALFSEGLFEAGFPAMYGTTPEKGCQKLLDSATALIELYVTAPSSPDRDDTLDTAAGAQEAAQACLDGDTSAVSEWVENMEVDVDG